jgi:hypothetical protein
VATISNLYVDQGSFYRTYVTVAGTDGVALDLTGYTAAAQMRKSYSSSVSYNFQISISNPTQGRVRIELSSTQSRNIPAGRYLYDLEVTDSNGEKLRVIEGIVTINPEITKV